MHRRDVTVVIPTRNRRSEVLASIDSVLASDHRELTVAVFDNCSEDGTAEAVRSRFGDRVVLQRSDTPLAMTDSFESAYAMARSEWVVAIGADDGLHPAAIPTFIQLALDHDVEVVTPTRATYYWPGSLPDEPAGLLGVPPVRPDRVVRSRTVVRGVLAGRRKWYELPAGYFGLVRTDILRRVERRQGRLFTSVTPDIGLGFAIAREIDRYVICGRPLFISGASPRSNGRSQFGSGDPAIVEQFWAENRRASVRLHPAFARIDDRLPPSIRAVILEAFLQSGDLGGPTQRLLSDMRVQALLAQVEHPDPDPDAWWRRLEGAAGDPYLRFTWSAVRMGTRVGRAAVSTAAYARAARRRAGRIVGRVPTPDPPKHAVRESGVGSLAEAAERLDRFLGSSAGSPPD